MKIKITLFTCGKCKKGYNNPATHVCKVSFTQAGKAKIAGVKRTPKKK